MKKNYQYILIFLSFAITTFLYSFFISKVTGDEIWNYGFAYNIYNGLIPYKDFNMIITPFFAFSTIPIFLLLGSKLISFHIYVSIIVSFTILFMYLKIGKQSFLVYPILLLAYQPSYNLFSVFLFSILILINDSKIKHKDIYLPLIVSIIFLTKQTIGLALFIPCIFYSKNKIKTIISFMIPIILFLIYLLVNNALYQFVDYCFLGMFSFSKENGYISLGTVIIIVCCLFFLYKLIKSKFKNSSYFYGLMFQIIALPMGDKYHFFMGLSVIFYVLLLNYKLPKMIFIYLLLFVYITTISINTIILLKDGFEIYLEKEHDLYIGRNVGIAIKNYIHNYECSLEQAKKLEYDNLFVFSSQAYFLKLSQKQKLNKFDLINNGNMGYKAHIGYIEDIESMCRKQNCVFIVENRQDGKHSQTNKEIFEYPQKHYELKYVVGQFEIYKN